jgi:dimethylglycine dehydrogenase
MMTRLEKAFPAWGTELSPDNTPWEAGLGRFVALDKGDFIGRDAAAKAKEAGPREVRVAFTVDLDGAEAQPHCDAGHLSNPDTLAGLPGGLCLWGDEALFRDGAWVGYVSSGGYGPKVGRHIALAYIRADALDAGSAYEIEILGRRCPARLAPDPLYDPKVSRTRKG